MYCAKSNLLSPADVMGKRN